MQNSKFKIQHSKLKSGFTLVELLVATAVFMSVMVVAVSSLIIIINTNNHTESIKSVVDNVTVAIDSISRDLRNATRLETDSYTCYPDSGAPESDCPSGVHEISAVIYKNSSLATTTVYYKFDPSPAGNYGNIQKCDASDLNTNCPTTGWKSMTAPTSIVSISNMMFYVIGQARSKDSSCSKKTQPRVIITGYGFVLTKNAGKTEFTLQTTSSRRSRENGICKYP